MERAVSGIIKNKECLRCGHRWYPVKPGNPVICPFCKSPYWDIIRKSTTGKTASERSQYWQKNNPEKYKAQKILKYAVKKGSIIKPKICENCGLEKRLHGHHPDYSKPLEVQWLCSPCHKLKHKNGILNGVAIKQAREELFINGKKMTIEDLRELLKREGIKRSYGIVWGWENDKMQPQDPEIIAEKLAKIFQKKKEFFLSEVKEVRQTTDTKTKWL